MTDAVPAGRYLADATHTSVTWRIKHMGLSWYTGRFARMAATLDFDPGQPERMRLEASVELTSVRTDYEGPAGDWDANLAGREDLLDAGHHPTARFVSRAVRRTGDATADVEGELSFRGHTRPLTFTTIFNGGVLKDQFGRTLVGFSARATLTRSDFGLTYFLGPLMPDEVQLIVETELALEA